MDGSPSVHDGCWSPRLIEFQVAKFSKIHPLLPCAVTKNSLTLLHFVGVNPEYFIPASLGAYCMVRYVVVRFFVVVLVFRLAKYFDFGKFQKTRLRLISSVWSTSRSLQRLLRDVACFGAGSFCGVAVSHPLQRTRADDMSHDVDQSDTAPGAAAALMRERVRTPLP